MDCGARRSRKCAVIAQSFQTRQWTLRFEFGSGLVAHKMEFEYVVRFRIDCQNQRKRETERNAFLNTKNSLYTSPFQTKPKKCLIPTYQVLKSLHKCNKTFLPTQNLASLQTLSYLPYFFHQTHIVCVRKRQSFLNSPKKPNCLDEDECARLVIVCARNN